MSVEKMVMTTLKDFRGTDKSQQTINALQQPH